MGRRHIDLGRVGPQPDEGAGRQRSAPDADHDDLRPVAGDPARDGRARLYRAAGGFVAPGDDFHSHVAARAQAPHRSAIRVAGRRSEEHTSELQSLMRISYAVFCLKKKQTNTTDTYKTTSEKT